MEKEILIRDFSNKKRIKQIYHSQQNKCKKIVHPLYFGRQNTHYRK